MGYFLGYCGVSVLQRNDPRLSRGNTRLFVLLWVEWSLLKDINGIFVLLRMVRNKRIFPATEKKNDHLTHAPLPRLSPAHFAARKIGSPCDGCVREFPYAKLGRVNGSSWTSKFMTPMTHTITIETILHCTKGNGPNARQPYGFLRMRAFP